MKTPLNSIKLVVIVVSLVLFATSCESDLNEVYSCDPEVNDWVNENKEDLSNINRRELLNHSPDVQRAIVRSFTAEKRFELWHEKINTLISQEQEKNVIRHLEKLRDHLTVQLFESPTKYRNKEFETEWINYTTEILNWEPERIVFTVMSLHNNMNEFLEEISEQPGLEKSFNDDCTCSTHWSTVDHCTLLPNRVCGHDFPDCTDTVDGCGWLGLYACNGVCIFG